MPEYDEVERRLQNLIIRVDESARTDWFVYVVLRVLPWIGLELSEKKKDELENILEGASNFSPPIHKEESNYPLPMVVFRLFDYADCPEDGTVLPGAHSIERFLIEEELNWIIDFNASDRKICAQELTNYARGANVPIAYMILEVLFSQLFRLPLPPQPTGFYGPVLLDLCRVQSSTMPQVLAQAAELLYQRAATMQPLCLDRFCIFELVKSAIIKKASSLTTCRRVFLSACCYYAAFMPRQIFFNVYCRFLARGSERGRSHASAHRIAFEALLEPAPDLICPICDLPQKTSDVACVFGCMFNDLDLRIVIVVGKIMKMQILDCGVVIHWIFSENLSQVSFKGYVS
ncbi:MIF4G like protein [Ostertagia ostertagi]